MPDNHLTSAAAFVEGGIQDACDDACSICLESFCDSDPSTVTNCKHEFHLQCVLEWCQRSSKCPMCWQPISLKDPSSQELLDTLEHEREIRMNPPRRNTTIFHHPTLGDFEIQHLPNATEMELENRIIQHLNAAAAMGVARNLTRRDGQRARSSAQGRPQLLVFSTHPNGSPAVEAAGSQTSGLVDGSVPVIEAGGSTSPLITVGGDSSQPLSTSPIQVDQVSTSASGAATVHGPSNNRRSPTQSSPGNQDRGGPSDFQTFSESLKSRLSAMSLRYKESITKSTRGWKERFFSRNASAHDLGSEVRGEGGPGVAAVSHVMDHSESRKNIRTEVASVSNNQEDSVLQVVNDQSPAENVGNHSLSEINVQAPCPASSGPN